MKTILRYVFQLTFLVIVLACQDDDWAPYPDWNENVGAATKIAVNANRNRYKISNGLSNEFIEFTLNVDGYDLTEVASVELRLSFFRGTTTLGPVLLRTVESFPSTVQVTAQEAVTAIGSGLTLNSLQNGDSFRLTFPIITTDGRRLTVALNSELCTNAAQPLFGSCSVAWNVVN